jgi:pimeloyl-ACP methyl ester carboxylesterase
MSDAQNNNIEGANAEVGSTDRHTATRPKWFERALAVPLEHLTTVVDGCNIHALAWGQPNRHGLVFVHGGAAHSHWWTHVAAQFADDYRVVAIDLSGHGDSDRRATYSLEQWTDEVMAVAKAADITGAPVVIGHSMGGFVTVVTAARYGSELAGVIVCDSPVTEPDPEVSAPHLHQSFGGDKVYASVDEAVARFRTVPPQRFYLDYVMDHVGRQSLRHDADGYRWKFDRNVFAQFSSGMRAIALPYLSDVSCRLALLRSQYGLVTADIGRAMYERLGRAAPVIEIPEAGHHAMLDQPLILLTAIRTLLADWDHSSPIAR